MPESAAIVRRFDASDEHREFPLGTFDLVQIRCCGRARYHRDMEPIAAEVAQLLDPIEATRLHRSLTALQRHVNHPLNARLFVEHMLFAYRQAFTRSAIPT